MDEKRAWKRAATRRGPVDWRGVGKLVAVAAVLALFAACGPAQAPVSRPGQPEPAPAVKKAPERAAPLRMAPGGRYYIHTVRWPGETLSIISAWYTKNAANWRVIATANPGLDPNRIHKGDQIRIPPGFMKRKDPLPASFVKRFLPKDEPEPKPAEPAPEEPADEEPGMFGPKLY